MISRIRVQNFRSLVNVDVELEPLTVLIGRSGTGKSNFVNAIRRLRGGVSGQQFFAETDKPFAGKPTSLVFEVELRLNGKRFDYAVTPHTPHSPIGFREELSANGKGVYEQACSKWLLKPNVIPAPPAGQLSLGTLTGLREATIVRTLLARGIGCYDFPGNVLQSGNVVGSTGYADDGQNYRWCAGAILDDLDRLDDWTSLVATMGALNPAVEAIDLLLPGRDQLRVGYRLNDRIQTVDVREESEGFRRYLATLLALYQAPAKQTVIIEHPENGIHPGALETLSNEFKRHVDQGRGQVILTTHSPQLLDHFEPEQIRVVDIENGQTRIGPLAPEQIEAIKERLLKPGELLTLDPARLAGQLAEVPA